MTIAAARCTMTKVQIPVSGAADGPILRTIGHWELNLEPCLKRNIFRPTCIRKESRATQTAPGATGALSVIISGLSAADGPRLGRSISQYEALVWQLWATR